MTASLSWKQAEFVRRMAENPENEQWGYELLLKMSEFPRFFDALRDAGMFEPTRNLGPVPGSEPGSVRIPYWPALDYLEACAKRSDAENDHGLAEKVLDVVRVVSRAKDATGQYRDNYHTHWKFAEIIGLVPLACVRREDLDLVSIWLDSRFESGLVTRALDTGVMRRLLDSPSPEHWSWACTVLRNCTAIRWVVDQKRRDEKKTPVTAAEDYWLNELLQHHASALGARARSEAAELFLDRVREVFGGIATSGASWLTRPAVEEHQQNHKWEGAPNRVVEGAREVLLAWASQDPAGTRPSVARLLRDSSDIVRRIALYVLNQRWEVLGEVFPPLISAALFDIGVLHELYALLRDRFAFLTPDQRSSIVAAIREIPLPTKSSEPDRTLRYVQKRWLSAIAGRGDAGADAWFGELKADESLGGISEHPDLLSYVETQWGPGPTAYQPEELVAFAREGTLVARLNAFQETGEWRDPTTSALVDALEEAVLLEPGTFADALPTFVGAKRPFQYGVLNGFLQAWKAPAEKRATVPWDSIWRALVAFFESTLGSPAFWTEAVEEGRDLTPNRNWIPPLVADFLKTGTTHDDEAYPEELLPRTWALLQSMLENAAATTPDDEPMNKAVNSAKGRVIEAVLSHALRVCRARDKVSGNHRDAWAHMRPTFDSELAKCANANFEFSTLAGAYVAQLQYMDPVWLRDNISRIFSERYDANFECAAAGLAYASVTRLIYKLLVETQVLDRVLRAAHLSRRTREQVVERVALAYLWGDEQLESPRFASLLGGDDLEDLKDVASYFWGIRNEELAGDQVARILAFWDRCVALSGSRAEPPKELLSRLSLLTCYVRTVDKPAFRLLLAVAPFAQLDHHGHQFIEQLDRLAEGAPAPVADVLEKFVEAEAPSFDIDGHLKSLLEKLAAHGQKEKAIVVADKVRRLPGMKELFTELSRSRSLHPR